MMKKETIALFFLGITTLASAQTMKEGLLNAVKGCYDSWSGEGKEYGSISYDIPNGYVKTSGGWPTCGCGCKEEAAAFKNANGKYTYVVSSFWDCNDYGKVFAKRDGVDEVNVLAIMPKNFGLESFAGYKPEVPSRFSFQVKFTIPREGTVMPVTLNVLPIGAIPKEENGLTYETAMYPEGGVLSMDHIKYISEKVDDNTLLLLASGKSKDISAEKMAIIEKYRGGVALASLCLDFMDLKLLYDIYMSLDCTEIDLGWNRLESRFEIKSKGTKPTKCSFKEFLTKVVQYAYQYC